MPAAKAIDPGFEIVQFRAESLEEVELFRDAAAAAGLRLSTWYRERALRAAGAVDLADAVLAEAVERGDVQRGREHGKTATPSVLYRLPPHEHAAIMAAIERSGYTQALWLRTVYRASAGDKAYPREVAELMALFARLASVKPRRAAGGRR
jgi:hypothetical protein